MLVDFHELLTWWPDCHTSQDFDATVAWSCVKRHPMLLFGHSDLKDFEPQIFNLWTELSYCYPTIDCLIVDFVTFRPRVGNVTRVRIWYLGRLVL
jgi:hypothetical protein